MKRFYALITAALLLFSAGAFADTYVDGYFRSDGTYVAPHYRSSPNQYKFDNYSSRGNVNPYTGQRGYKRHEFTNPPSYNKSYGGSRGYGDGYYDFDSDW